MRNDPEPSQPPEPAHPEATFRWVCDCEGPRGVLLATYTEAGEIRIKARDRYVYARGWARAICPRCGRTHVLDLRDRVDES